MAAVSGTATTARSSAVIRIALPSVGLGIIPLFAARIRRRRLFWLCRICLLRATVFGLQLSNYLSRLYIDEPARSRVEGDRNNHWTKEEIPRQETAQKKKSQREENFGDQLLQAIRTAVACIFRPAP